MAAAGALAMVLGRPATRQRHFDALDGLRGLAVLVVIASHMALLGFLPGVQAGGMGKSGVYLFFVLSAFLLTRVLLDRPPAAFTDGWLWGGYALRRVLRIWPLYLVVLLASWGVTRVGVAGWPYPLDTAALLRHLALQEGQSVLWSIPVEFKFYLLLPVIAFVLAWMAHRRVPLGWQAAAFLVAIGCCTVAWPPGETARNDVRLGPYLVVFLCGAFAAAIDRSIAVDAARRRRPRAWGAAGVLALVVAGAASPASWSLITGSPLDLRVSHHWFLLFGVAWSTLLLSALHGPRWWTGIFGSAGLRLVGVVSFSAYLWHLPVLLGLRAAGVGAWPAAPAWMFSGVLLASLASFLLVERPWRDVRLRRGPRRADGKIDGSTQGGSPS